MSSSIDYTRLMDRAMRSLIKEALSVVAENGLPGDHHFYISFETNHPDVAAAVHLLSQYPKEMTIVLQHWFEHLHVDEEGFTVTLNFGDTPEPFYIPYEAILSFVDPSVEFGLRFTIEDEELSKSRRKSANTKLKTNREAESDSKPQKNADVVSLDSFRKKPDKPK